MKKEKVIYQLLDFRVLVYMMYSYYGQMKEISPISAENWTILMWKFLFNRGFTGLPYRESKIIVVDDSQEDYWKRGYLDRLGYAPYKSGRSSKTAEWYEIERIAKEGIVKKNIPYLQYPEFEADDIAGALCKLIKEHHKDEDYIIVLNTVDTDWMGLIDHKVWWANLKHYEPRLRTLNNYKEWNGINKFKTEINKPTDIWLEKSINGDKSDNLFPGSPIEVIDLLNPPSQYDLCKIERFKLSVKSILKKGKKSNEEELKKDIQMIVEKGYIIPFTEWNRYPVLDLEEMFTSKQYTA
jgi:5'-3' exonuclease